MNFSYIYAYVYRDYEDILKELHPEMNEHDLMEEVDKNFASWFENYVSVQLIITIIIFYFFCQISYVQCSLLSYRHA